jgi:TolA-binding protein
MLMVESHAATPAVKGNTALARYEQAVADFDAHRNDRARKSFESLLQDASLPADLQDNCYYWLGESHYAREAWQDALGCFLKVLEHEESNKEEDARLKLALCWQNLGERDRACSEARALLGRFPAGASAPRAKRMLERCRP